MPEELFFQGEMVAFVAAETEDHAEDAVSRDRSGVRDSSVGHQSRAGHGAEPAGPQQPQHRGNVVKTLFEWGDVDKAFAQADVVKEFSYFFNGGIIFPFQPLSCVAEWENDKLTMWVLTQRTYLSRTVLAQGPGHSGRIRADQEAHIRQRAEHHDREQGSRHRQMEWRVVRRRGRSDGPHQSLDRAHREGDRHGRCKLMLPKDQELPVLRVKPQNLTKFKVGATKDGKIVACAREFHVNTGCESRYREAQSTRAREAADGRSFTCTPARTGERPAFSTARIRCGRARPAATPSRSSSGAGNR